jgi:branched-chain amino acid transport system permease protein
MAKTARRGEAEVPVRDEEGLLPAREIDLRRGVRLGAVGGLVLVFVASIGMIAEFDERRVVDGLTLAYVVLVAIPMAIGYLAGKPPEQLEGYAATPRSVRSLLAGLIAGSITGGIGGLYAIIAPVEFRNIFPNISPTMVELLTFGLGTGLGALVLLFVGTVSGAAGGGLRMMPDRWRRSVLTAVLWVLIFGVMDSVVAQILRASKSLGIDLLIGVFGEQPEQPFLLGLLYEPGGGMEPVAAIVIAVAAFGLAFWMAGRKTTLRARFIAMPPDRRRRTKLLGAVVLLLILAILPLVLGRFLSQVLDIAAIFLLMGLGLNIVVGFAGMLDLGYVAFFAVGAYTTAVLTSPISPAFSTGGWFEGLVSPPALGTFFLAIPFVMLAAALAGMIVGTPVLRMRGDYLAIVTLGFGEIARILFISIFLEPAFGAARGVRQVPSVVLTPLALSVIIGIAVAFVVFLTMSRRLAGRERGRTLPALGAAVATLAVVSGIAYLILGTVLSLAPIELDNPQYFFYGVVIAALIAAYVSWSLEESRIGRAWMAMREDELVAEAMGVNIVSAKLWAFIVGAMLASLGGALFATKIHSIFPGASFSIVTSLQVLIIVILGGMGSMRGVVAGAFVIIALPNLLREFEAYRFLLYGALLIYMMLQRPEGLIPSRRRAAELHEEERGQDAWLQKAQEEARAEGEARPAPSGTT